MRITGKAEPKVIGKKQAKVVWYDPSIVVIKGESVSKISIADKLKIALVKMRVKMVRLLQKMLPEPHGGLAAGILLGVKSNMSEEFYQSLINTGTLHVVAASGYNVSIVLRVVMGLAVLYFSRRVGLMVGLVAVVAYVMVAGASAAVVRAGLMGVLAYSAFFWGRVANAKRLLFIAAYVMLLMDPLLIVDVGFQLSVAATAGILYIEPIIRKKVEGRWGRLRSSPLGKYLAENLYPTVAACIVTLPIILWWFGRVSWVSPLVNVLVLGLVPVVMLMSAVSVLFGMIHFRLGWMVAMLLYVPLEMFVVVVRLFS